LFSVAGQETQDADYFVQSPFVTEFMPVELKDVEFRDVAECYALLRMRPLSNSCAECSVVFSCGKVDYDKSG
jgi:hypothetical protein